MMRHEVEDFLYYDAELLDSWQLREWFELFTPECRYLVPATDRPFGDPETDLFLIRDDWFLLSQRVDALIEGTAWAESPHSTTHRMISNVRAREVDDGRIETKADVLVHRSRAERIDAYPAQLTLTLVRGGSAGFEIVERRAVLAMEQLRRSDTPADRRLYEALLSDDFATWSATSTDDVTKAGQQEVLNWFALMGAARELEAKRSWSTFVETWIFNSNKVFATWEPTR